MKTNIKLTPELFLIGAMALLPLIGVLFPRFYALAPAVIGIPGAAAYWLQTKNQPAMSWKILLFPLVLSALGMLSILWSINRPESFERVLNMQLVFIPGLIFTGYLQCLKPEKLRPYLWFIPVGIIAGCLLASLDVLLDNPLYRLTRGIEQNEHFSTAIYNRGCVAITLFLFPAFFFLKESVSYKWLKFALPAAFLALLAAAESQSAQLAIMIGLLTYWIFPYKRPKAWYALIILLSTLVFVAPIMASYLYDNFAAQLNSMPFLGQGSGYAGGRLEIWDFVSRRALEHPITGHGIEATRSIRDFDTKEIYHHARDVLHPHNFAIQFWIEFGLIGATAASALLAYIILIIKKLGFAAQRIILPTFMTGLCIASTSYGFWQSWWLGLLFVIAGLCVLVHKMTRQEQK